MSSEGPAAMEAVQGMRSKKARWRNTAGRVTSLVWVVFHLQACLAGVTSGAKSGFVYVSVTLWQLIGFAQQARSNESRAGLAFFFV